MNQHNAPIDHPLALEKFVIAKRPSCACVGAHMIMSEGVIKKVIKNNSGHWYYLSTGVTVRDIWITDVK